MLKYKFQKHFDLNYSIYNIGPFLEKSLIYNKKRYTESNWSQILTI